MPTLIDRRELLKLASATLVGLAAGQKNFAMPGALVQNVAHDANWAPAFFNAHQNETVVCLTNLIIPRTDTPGANDANVHRYIDLFLSVGKPEDQKAFTGGLAWLDSYAAQSYKNDFVKCSEKEQTAILDRMAGIDKTPIDEIGHAFFNQAKAMTSSIYFATPEGYKELAKSGPPPASFGCEHTSATHSA